MEIYKENNFISAVIYLRNDENQIDQFLNELYSSLESHFDNYEIICVNDSSEDQTLSKIKEFSKSHNCIIRLMHMSFPQGLELSLNAGVDLAIGDFVYEFDQINFNYPPTLFFEVYEHALKGFDVVSVAPKSNRFLSSSLFYTLFNQYSYIPNKLSTHSFRLVSRRAINRVQSLNIKILYRKAVYLNCGLNADTITYNSSISKSQNQTIKFRSGTALDALILFTDLTFKFSFLMTSLMMIGTLGISIYSIWIFLNYKPVEGWTTTILFLTVAFFGVFSILTIMLKYLSLIIKLIFEKQDYVVKDIEIFK